MIYISQGEWFMKGAMCELLDDYRPRLNCGLFAGARQGDDGAVYQDEELCSFDEFMEPGVSTEGASWAMEGAT